VGSFVEEALGRRSQPRVDGWTWTRWDAGRWEVFENSCKAENLEVVDFIDLKSRKIW
jgi:hypothetical protein